MSETQQATPTESGAEVLDDRTAPRPGLVFEHCIYTTGYNGPDGPEPVIFEITEVTDDGKVYYGPAQRGIATKATLWIWTRDFRRDALSKYVGDRRAA